MPASLRPEATRVYRDSGLCILGGGFYLDSERRLSYDVRTADVVWLREIELERLGNGSRIEFAYCKLCAYSLVVRLKRYVRISGTIAGLGSEASVSIHYVLP